MADPLLLPDVSAMRVKAMKQELQSYGMVHDIFVERNEIEAALLRGGHPEVCATAATNDGGVSAANGDGSSRYLPSRILLLLFYQRNPVRKSPPRCHLIP